MSDTRKCKIDKMISIILSVTAVIVISLVGIVLLRMESVNNSVIMKPETEYIENEDEKVNNQNTIININTASAQELMLLPGIGEKKAEDIVNYRTKTPFLTKEDIMNVKGIGKSIFEDIKDKICVE